MDCNLFIAKPSNSNTYIHIVFTSCNNDYIILFRKSHFFRFFRRKECSCCVSCQSIGSVYITIMNTRHSLFYHIRSNETFSSNERSHFAQLLVNQTIGGVILSKLNNWSR